MNRAKRIAIFEILRELNPRPATELTYGSPFELLVAVMLSAQATDVSVNKVSRHLFAVAKTPEAFVRLGLARLRGMIRTIGLYNTKAANLIHTCRILIHEHGSRVPSDRHALERLPGVGRKTANVVLNTAFGVPVIAVDTHIFRVANRTGLAPGKNVREVEERLDRVVPDEFRKDAHHWLILHGRYVCTARSPKCAACPIFAFCEWRGRHQAAAGESRAGARRSGDRPRRSVA
ncbi:MAG: endonuclease III [Gammaproteobacteria bacterium]|nr:endonuclease III [Gammaproteobacteria bacterium]